MKELNLPEKCEHGLIDKKGIYNDIFPLSKFFSAFKYLESLPKELHASAFRKNKDWQELSVLKILSVFKNERFIEKNNIE